MWHQVQADLARETVELLQGDAALARLIASAAPSAGTVSQFLPVLTELVRLHPNVHDVLISDDTGNIVARAHRDELSDARRKGAMASSPIRPSGSPEPLLGPVLIRTSEASDSAVMLGVSVGFQSPGLAGLRHVAVLTLGADMPSARGATGQAWLIGADGVVLAAPGQRVRAEGTNGVVPDWTGLHQLPALAGVLRLEMADGAHEMLYQRLEPWPATLVIDTGPVISPWLRPQLLLAIALGTMGVFLLLRGQARAAGDLKESSPAGEIPRREELMRQFAARLAHRFNNIMTVLAIDAEMLAASEQADRAIQVLSRSMLGATAEGTQLTQALLSYAERAVLQPQAVELEQMLLQCHDRLLAALEPDQTLVRVGAAGALGRTLIHVDPDALENCLVSLLRNAANVAGPGGEITLEVDVVNFSGVEYLEFVVDDAGPGMDRPVLADAMLPGFSTRSDGRHLGLGLSAANGFARQSGGSLALESKPALGTRARLLLPVMGDASGIAGDGATPQARASTDPAALPTLSRRKRVLLVEDNVAVRDSITRRLQADGFEIVNAATVAEVLAQVARGVDVMVADIVLNDEVDGWAMASRAREADPLLPLVFMSGYLSSRQPELLAGDDLASFVRKPVNGVELNTVIAGLLALRETRALQGRPRPLAASALREGR